MVTEKKINVNGKEYWILIHSVRKGKKVIQKKILKVTTMLQLQTLSEIPLI